MIPEPLGDKALRRVFERCLKLAVEEGAPALLGGGLSGSVIQAINDVSLEFPVPSEETIERAKKVFEDELASNA